MVVYGGGTGAFDSGTTRGFGGWERTPLTMRMAGKGGGGVNEDGLLPIDSSGCNGQQEERLLWLLGMSAMTTAEKFCRGGSVVNKLFLIFDDITANSPT